jgi:hypothetical protein
VADEQVARVEVDGARLRITGVAPGRTQVALVGEGGVHVLAVVVASP